MTRFVVSLLCSIALLLFAALPPAVANGLKLLKRFDNKHGTTSGISYSGSWGYVGPDGREYAILGTATGTAIIEITDTSNIHEIGHVPGPTSIWREMRTYKNRLYIVSEGGGGTTIVNLSNLPTGVQTVKSFTYTSGTKNTGRSHTIEIFDGYMYLNGCANWSPGGVLIFSLADPDNPQFMGEYQPQYVHDSYVRHDTIFAASVYSGGGLNIGSVVNKSSPSQIAKISYSGSGTHNVWTTTDGKYAITTDEIGTTPKTLKIWDIQSLPSVPTSPAATYQFSPSDIEHNVFVRGNYAYTAWYTAGIIVVDMHNPLTPVNAGFYDTSNDTLYPAGNYDGVWAVYPYFWSKKVTAGDMQNGLYVFEFDSLQARTPVNLMSPSHQSVLCDNAPITFRWTRAADPVTDPHQYLLGLKGPGIDTLIHVSTDTSFTLLNPGGLRTGTFSWYVVTKDEANQVSSQDTFTFARPQPAAIAPNGGELMKVSSQFNITWSWPCPDSLEISLSTNNGSTWNPVAHLPSSVSSYLWTVPIAPTALARIRLRDVNDTDRVDMSDSTFTIYNPASITVTSPHGGEQWQSGVIHQITWTSGLVDSVQISYSTNGGSSWATLVADTAASVGSYDWTVPFVSTARALVSVTDRANPTVSDLSDAFFSISPVTFQVATAWNLVSMPVAPENKLGRFNFPGARGSIFKYAGNYSPTDSVENGNGYWVKYDSAATLYAIGSALDSITIPLSGRWNMIGSLTHAIHTSSTVALPVSMTLSPYYGYTPGFGYEIADSLLPGKGYWVKASQGGTLLLNGSAVEAPQIGLKTPQALKNDFGFITFEDAAGNRRTLWFCPKNSFTGNTMTFNLPPRPPSGVFDVRYASDQLLALLEEGIDHPIVVSSAHYPLKVSWDGGATSAHAFLHIDGKNIPLVSDGDIQIPHPISHIDLSDTPLISSGLPKQFALDQNYPNPFNPASNFGFRISDFGFVSLKVFDALGREVATLVNEVKEPGEYTVTWNAEGVPSGVYFYRLTAGSFSDVKSMILLK